MSWGLAPGKIRFVGTLLVVFAVLLPFAIVLLRAALWEAPTEPAPETRDMPLGRFQMGSPPNEPGRFDDETLHEVILTRPFALAVTEVTQEQFRSVMGENPVESLEDDAGDSCAAAGVGVDLPVVCVSWREAVEYCNLLSRRERLEEVYEIIADEVRWRDGALGYRLPTEAEWEYAARAGEEWTWVGTNAVEEVCGFANVADLSAKKQHPEWDVFQCDDGYAGLAPVRALRPNAWGFYGFEGNAAEWVWDGYGGDFSKARVTNPSGDDGASDRVIRGGSWGSDPRVARAAVRDGGPPSSRYDFLGFRVARSLSGPLALGPLDVVSLDSGRQPGPQRDGSASEAAGAGEARPGADSRGEN